MPSVSPSLVTRFSTLFTQRSHPRPFRRRLQGESLENRLALTAAAGVEVAAVDASLAQYLAQTQEVGPVAPTVADATIGASTAAESLEAQAVDAAIAAVLSSDPAAEGEDNPPTFTSFQVYRNSGWVFVSGQIADENPLNSYISINGVQFWAEIAGVDSAGNFMLARADEGGVGIVEAYAYDFYGNMSPKAVAVLC